MESVLQDWVMTLGLRHQGVLLTAVRGCDTAPKEDTSKDFTRAYRSIVLNAFCGDAKKSATFIEYVEPEAEIARFLAFRKNLDPYPHHFVMHFCHAIEIVGYKHPDAAVRERYLNYYRRFCRGLHVTPETEAELDERLGANEHVFGTRDKEHDRQTLPS